ncbi:MAG: transaldolase family protein [Elusimicrobiota bacterium]
MNKTKMKLTQELGADFWNDSCSLTELAEAVAQGAVGATSNPVIVLNAVSGAPETWLPEIDRLVAANPADTEDEIAWKLIAELGERAAKLLAPLHSSTKGEKGFLCVQVSPKYYRSPALMIEQAKSLAKIAPNVAIKIPATEAGLAAMEETIAAGVNVNATVSFSVAQAVAVAEAYERGMKKAEKAKRDLSQLHPYVTIMVGRVDDMLKRAKDKRGVDAAAESLAWAGIAVFKRAHQIFQERRFRSTLLAAAYRHEGHWSQLIGDDVVLSIPYKWWKQFNESSTVPTRSIGKPVDTAILRDLLKFDEFRRAYEPGALKPSEFVRFDASASTLNEFLEGYQKLLAIVRARMF